MNAELIEQNVHRLLGAMTGAATTAMAAIGDQLGLYRALADGGPATQDELAARTGMAPRYLREWLSQQAAAGFITYQAGDGRYALPAEAAAVLVHEASPPSPAPRRCAAWPATPASAGSGRSPRPRSTSSLSSGHERAPVSRRNRNFSWSHRS